MTPHSKPLEQLLLLLKHQEPNDHYSKLEPAIKEEPDTSRITIHIACVQISFVFDEQARLLGIVNRLAT